MTILTGWFHHYVGRREFYLSSRPLHPCGEEGERYSGWWCPFIAPVPFRRCMSSSLAVSSPRKRPHRRWLMANVHPFFGGEVLSVGKWVMKIYFGLQENDFGRCRNADGCGDVPPILNQEFEFNACCLADDEWRPFYFHNVCVWILWSSYHPTLLHEQRHMFHDHNSIRVKSSQPLPWQRGSSMHKLIFGQQWMPVIPFRCLIR